jgi:2-polyprenyl-6-hydroxyphenyl methylase/3-demethylubiquinone-9 3-methyltransferase
MTAHEHPAPAAGSNLPEYGHVFSGPGGAFGYLEDSVAAFLPRADHGLRILDVGCGNGYWALRLAGSGHRVVGIDASAQRIENARREIPGARFERLEIGETLLQDLGEEPFDVVISTEVVEHLFQPAEWATTCFAALRPGGRLICLTPYHGYLKNLAIALTNTWDRHHHTLRRLGHIKFFSESTLRKLLEQIGFTDVRFRGAGRIPYLWKTMVMAGDRPVRSK